MVKSTGARGPRCGISASDSSASSKSMEPAKARFAGFLLQKPFENAVEILVCRCSLPNAEDHALRTVSQHAARGYSASHRAAARDYCGEFR
jgi:hypothetical protein